MTLTVKTNNHPREVLYWWELTTEEQAQFDYLDTDEKQMETRFARYRGQVYDLSEFMRANKDLFHGWDGYASDSFFSGVLIRFPKNDYAMDTDHVVMATYFS